MSQQVATHISTNMSVTAPLHSQQRLYKERLSLAVCLSMGDKFLHKNQFQEANDAFDSAHRFLTTTPSISQRSLGNLVDPKSLNMGDNISTLSPSSLTTTSQPLTHIDCYHEDECDVGPRTFDAAIVPEDIMGLDVDVLQLLIAYNQALVYQASNNHPLASQLYKFITGTIATYMASGNADATLTHLAMRAHNNLGQILYTVESQECALAEYENALKYAGHHYNISRVAGSTSSDISSSLTASIQVNPLTTSPGHQLEIATVLSNWCRTRWMMAVIDQNVYDALNDILQIRLTNLRADHPDIAAAHFNIGRLEYSRDCNEKALKHLLQYIQIASSSKTCMDKYGDVELDPVQGLIYVLQIQNEDKYDDVSTDLVWGLQSLQDKRQELGLIHSDVASVLNYIGTLLFRRRELDYALCFFAQELRVEEKLKSQSGNDKSAETNEDVSISVTCNNIGRILQELGRYSEAKFYYERSLGDKNTFTEKRGHGIKRKCMSASKASEDTDMICDDDSVDISDIPAAAMNLYSTVWYNLGLIHDKMGDFKEAIRSFRMSLKLRRHMLGHEHSDVSCLFYNIGVLQMEQKLLDDATESFRQALASRHVSGKGQLNDLHVIKTLRKLSSMHKAKGNVNGALEAYCDVLSVLSTSNDLDQRTRNVKTALVMRDIADLHQAQGNLQVALKHASGSVDLFRGVQTSSVNDATSMDTDYPAEERPFVEELTKSLHLVGSLHHELCEPENAQKAFSEAACLVQTTLTNLTDASKYAATLNPLMEVSAMLSSPNCAPEA